MATAKKPELDHEFTPYPARLEHLDGVCCECGDYHDERRSPTPRDPFEVRLANLAVADLLMPDTFGAPFPPPEPPITDESLIARNHALREALRNLTKEHESVVDNCIDPKQHMFAEQQERLHRAARALNVAKAALVEEEGK